MKKQKSPSPKGKKTIPAKRAGKKGNRTKVYIKGGKFV